MNLFIKQNIVLNSGAESNFKIECDALTDSDLECLAYLVSLKYRYSCSFGVPRGGKRFSEYLMRYRTIDQNLPALIVDDVLTTGKSMNDYRGYLIKNKIVGNNYKGIVIFSRGKCPEWIEPIFKMWQPTTEAK